MEERRRYEKKETPNAAYCTMPLTLVQPDCLESKEKNRQKRQDSYNEFDKEL